MSGIIYARQEFLISITELIDYLCADIAPDASH